MNSSFKHLIKKVIESIDFPILVYGYETNRIIYINTPARMILGKAPRNIKDLSADGSRKKYPKELLENGSQTFYQVNMYNGKKNIQVDENISVIELDNAHICFVFFQHSCKNNFGKNLCAEVPRIFWKFNKNGTWCMNEYFVTDIPPERRKEHFLIPVPIKTEEPVEIDEPDGRFDSICLVNNAEEGFFVKVNEFPMTNKYGNAVGKMGIYRQIIDKVDFIKNYESAMEDAYLRCIKESEAKCFLEDIINLCHEGIDPSLTIRELFKRTEGYTQIEGITIARFYPKLKKVECPFIWGSPEGGAIISGKYSEDTHEYFQLVKDIKKQGRVVMSKKGKNLDMQMALYYFPFDEESVGVICFSDSKKRVWTEEDLQILNSVKDVAAIILKSQ